jgi:hypothetical protein
MEFHSIIENKYGNLRLENTSLWFPGAYMWKDTATKEYLYAGCNENDTTSGTLYSRFERGIRALLNTLNTNANGEYVDWQERHSLEQHLHWCDVCEREEYIVSNIQFGFVTPDNREAHEHHLIEKYKPIYNVNCSTLGQKFSNAKTTSEQIRWAKNILDHNKAWPAAKTDDPVVCTLWGKVPASEIFANE